MPTTAAFTITQAGLNAAAAAGSNGFTLALTHVVFGAGQRTITGAETALADRREKATMQPGSVVVDNSVTVVALFRGANYTGAAYSVGEIGFYAGDPDAGGTLYAIASASDANYGPRGGSAGDTAFSTTLVLAGSAAGTISITVDEQGALAAILLAQHTVTTGNPHPQYVLTTDPAHLLPPGMVADFAGPTAPAGWLVANGAAVSRTTYAALFAYIGTYHGEGDGSTTFNLPDYRGEFRRGLDLGRGVDPDRVLGSAQDDMLEGHSHMLPIGDESPSNFANAVYGKATGQPSVSVENFQNSLVSTARELSAVTGGTETRPRNKAVLVCIKY
jgi:microcystin-dependent protein